MRKNARDRQCPKCGRKGALKRVTEAWGDQVASIIYCRWKDHDPPMCDYEHVRVTTLTSTDPA